MPLVTFSASPYRESWRWNLSVAAAAAALSASADNDILFVFDPLR